MLVEKQVRGMTSFQGVYNFLMVSHCTQTFGLHQQGGIFMTNPQLPPITVILGVDAIHHNGISYQNHSQCHVKKWKVAKEGWHIVHELIGTVQLRRNGKLLFSPLGGPPGLWASGGNSASNNKPGISGASSFDMRLTKS
jgi:hypothetical protein